MDDLTLALSKFGQLHAKTATGLASSSAAEFSHWIQQYVCPVATRLTDDGDFQTYASWPIDHLAPRARTHERQLVNDIDRALTDLAKLLVAFSQERAVRAELLQRDDNVEEVATETATSTPQLKYETAIQQIATRPWDDLAVPQEFFFPHCELNLTDDFGPDFATMQLADFNSATQPRLLPLGDFISRMCFLRIEHWLFYLRRFCILCHAAAKLGNVDEWQHIQSESAALEESLAQLHHQCEWTEEAELREACIVLVQVLAEYRPTMTIDWLRIPGGFPTHCVGLRHRIEQLRDLSVVDQIANALARVRVLGRTIVDETDDILQYHIAKKPLVLVAAMGRQELYWHRKQVDVEWEKYPARWELLEKLVRAARHGTGTTERHSNAKRMADARARVKFQLPHDLDELIISGGHGCYRLDLPSDQVCIFEGETVDRLAVASA